MYNIAVITGIGGMCSSTWTSCLQSWPGLGYFWGLNLATAKTYFGSSVWYHILDAATSYLAAVWLQWSRMGCSSNWNAVVIHPCVILVHDVSNAAPCRDHPSTWSVDRASHTVPLLSRNQFHKAQQWVLAMELQSSFQTSWPSKSRIV